MIGDEEQDDSVEIGLRRCVNSREKSEDVFQPALRPGELDDYIGQRAVLAKLRIAVSAAARREEPLDHVMLHGPPGLGKTTLAGIIAHERGAAFKATSGPVLERPSDLAAILSSLEANDVLFIDEIHRLSRVVEEILYPAMEDFTIDIMVGQGPAARSVKLEVKPFTLIAATTRIGALTSPLRDRFGIIERMDFYSYDELERIVLRSAGILGVPIEQSGAAQIARRSRGTPRIANRLLRRARDYAQEIRDGTITDSAASEALALLEIDEEGCDKMDRLLMFAIIDTFVGGPVGLDTLAAAINEDKDTIEDVYEPFLIQRGFLMRTPRGRIATEKSYKHFKGITKPEGKDQDRRGQIEIW